MVAGERVIGSFHVKVPADVSTDFAIVITTFPDLRSWIFRWAPGLPVDDHVIACELPRAQDAPAVGEVTEILLLTEEAGPVSTRVWEAPPLGVASGLRGLVRRGPALEIVDRVPAEGRRLALHQT